MSYGFLCARPILHKFWPYQKSFGPHIPPTRPEEYHFVLQKTASFEPGTLILDAASGWVPGDHILAHLLALEHKFSVIALDADPEALWRQEPHPRIVRMMGDICAFHFADESFSVVLCISTLEHLLNTYRDRALGELSRVCSDTLIITMDGQFPPYTLRALEFYGFDCGDREDEPGEVTTPPVSYVVAHRTQRLLQPVDYGPWIGLNEQCTKRD